MTVHLVPPLSKSDAQRALVLAELWGQPLDTLWAPDEALAGDVRVLRAGLEALRRPTADIDCRDGGAPFRFLLTQAALSPGRTVRFTGTPRLGERPHEPLVRALVAALGPLGLAIEARGSPWPLVVTAPPSLAGVRRFTVTGEESSQFASSLLLGAARVARLTGEPCEVALEGAFTSEGYLELTRAWLRRGGFEVSDGPVHVVRAVGPPGPLTIPGDWSSLTYLLALSWRTGAAVDRVDFTAAHPDRLVVHHLESVGLRVSRSAPVHVEGTAVRGLAVDAQVCPDAVPTMAALAAVLPAPSTFTRAGILRHKESDRLEGAMRLLGAAGAVAELDGDTLTVRPAPLHDFSFDPRDDHRMVMSAVVLSVLGGVRAALHGTQAVAKSFPRFFEEVAKLGPRREEFEQP